MDTLELITNLSIVFEKEESDIKKGSFTYTLDKANGSVIKYPNAETLIDLYGIIKHDATLSSYLLVV